MHVTIYLHKNITLKLNINYFNMNILNQITKVVKSEKHYSQTI